VGLDSLGRPSLPESELVRAQSRESERFQEEIEQAPEIEITYVEEGSFRGSRIVNEPGYLPGDRTSPQELAGADTTEILPLDPSAEIRSSRAVFGVDDRGVPRLEMPYYLIGRLNIESTERPGMLGGHCTASLVGPRHILTASHCFKKNEAGKVTRAVFLPYYDRGSSFDDRYAHVVSVSFGENPPETGSSSDYAIAVLDRRLGEDLGWFGFRQAKDQWLVDRTRPGATFISGGYSGDWFQGHVMGLDWGTWLYGRFSEDRYTIGHDGDSTPGSSGGPVFAHFRDSGWQIVAINIAGPVDPSNPEAAFPDYYPSQGIANIAVDVSRFDHVIRDVKAAHP